MKEPFIEKIDLLDTEYAQLLERGIDELNYPEDRAALSSSRTALTRLKVTCAIASVVMLLGTGFLAFQLVNYQLNQASDDVTSELKLRLALEIQRQQLLELEQKSLCP